MLRSAREKLKLTALSLAVVLAARAVALTIVLASGFRALSDDDFSRVAIAQAFALHPSWDPSGTSWLPFPFWLYGACLACLGPSLGTARGVACALGLLGALGVWLAARWLGLSRRASAVGALFACALPYAAWLGVATTPDFYSAVLTLLACASLARARLSIRVLGAAALFAATLSRYEAWPVAVMWACFVSSDAVRYKSWRLFVLALLVLAAPVAWMLHGIVSHHDALFFVKRVVNYRRALGVVDRGALSRLLATPAHLIKDAPELWAITLAPAIAAFWGKMGLIRRRWLRPALAVFAILVFLSIGDWRDGAPTHHAGRTLLPLWLFVGIVTASAIDVLARRTKGTRKLAGVVLSVAVVGFAFFVVRPAWTKLDAFSPRIEETELGILAAARVAPGQRLAIDTSDYGYFAVAAAFARPSDTAILDAHDPRLTKQEDFFASSAGLEQSLTVLGARWLVAQRIHEPCVSEIARIHQRGPTLLLAELLQPR